MLDNHALPPRLRDVAYPTVAHIRKGKPKIKVTKGDRTYEQLAPKADLNQKFRVHFLPGTDNFKELYGRFHPGALVKYPDNSTIADGYEVTEIRAIVPVRDIWKAWRKGYVAHNDSREIARTDEYGHHFITKRDPLTGKYLVRRGEPFTPFTPGETINYQKNGKDIELKFTPYGQLRLVCSDMIAGGGQLVEFELKTTSFYDCQKLEAQLAGISALADAASGANAAGIPLRIFRMEEEVLWNKPDGGGARVKKWLVNIQADPAWVKNTFNRLGQMALAGGEAGYLPASVTVSGDINPADDNADELPDESIDGEEVHGPAAAGDTSPIIINSTTPEPIAKKYMDVDKAGRMQVIVKREKVFMNKLTDDQLIYIAENHKDEETIKAADSLLYHRKQAKVQEVA